MDTLVPAAWVRCVLALIVLGNQCRLSSGYNREDIIKSLVNNASYDSSIPPNFEDDYPTEVTIQVFVLSFNSVTETAMDYSMTIFLRESWLDKRLAWNDQIMDAFVRPHAGDLDYSSTDTNQGNASSPVFSTNDSVPTKINGKNVLERLEVDTRMIDSFWLPDLYFINGKDSKIHEVTFPNRLLHVYRNGTVAASFRISTLLSCDLHLSKYPHDVQTCSLFLGSYGYSVENVIFKWHQAPVTFRDGVTLPQFEVETAGVDDCNFKFEPDSIIKGNYTCIRAKFKLKRQVGYYIAQVYVPSILIVILSWVSFWIDLDATPARVSLGLLTVLTLTTQSTGEKASLPRVSYLKALDVWMAGCLIFVFAALLEFAYGNVKSRVQKRHRDTPSAVTTQTNVSVLTPSGPQLSQPPTPPPVPLGNPGFGAGGFITGSFGNGSLGNGDFARASFSHDPAVSRKMSRQEMELMEMEIEQKFAFMKSLNNLEKARMVDKVSRIVFPLAFLIFNIVYWVVYLVDF